MERGGNFIPALLYSRVEIGSNPEIIIIKRQDLSLDVILSNKTSLNILAFIVFVLSANYKGQLLLAHPVSSHHKVR